MKEKSINANINNSIINVKTVKVKFRKNYGNCSEKATELKEMMTSYVTKVMNEFHESLEPKVLYKISPLFLENYRNSLISKLGIKNLIYQAGQVYELPENEAYIYFNITDEFRDDDNGDMILPKVYPSAFKHLIKVTKPIAFAV